MSYNFYIDESGNTGDVTNFSQDFNFANQPIFSLGCIGIPVDKEFEVFYFLENLKVKYKIKAENLKSTKIYHKKPEFLRELFLYIKFNGFPVFVEVVDKKYYLIAHMVNCIVLPQLSCEDIKSHFMRQRFAEYLYDTLPNDLLLLFVTSCKSGDIQDTIDTILSIVNYYKKIQDINIVRLSLLSSILMTLNEIDSDLKESVINNSHYIPSSESLKSGSPTWMLPNLTSFYNIYARINKSKSGDISEINFIHDGQTNFDDIIKAGKLHIENEGRFVKVYTPMSDFNFNATSKMSFEPSTQKKGIQMADLISGFCMRHIQNTCIKDEHQTAVYKECYSILNSIINENESPAISQVVPTKFLILTSS